MILEDKDTVWQKATQPNHRVVVTLFAGKAEAIEKMNALALAVRRYEEAEIVARRADPNEATSQALTSAVQQMREEAAGREARMLQQHQLMFQQLMAVVRPGAQMPEALVAAPVEEAPVQTTPADPDAALTSARMKHKRESQEDVQHFSSWSDLAKALVYARTELAPREKEEGHTWRILRREDGREDKSRDKQWRNYRALAISVGLLKQAGSTEGTALQALQARLLGFGAKAHTPFLRSCSDEQKKLLSKESDAIARAVLGY